LDFHNALTIQGGETGASNNWSYTYNHDAAIFKYPSTSYQVYSDGTPPKAVARLRASLEAGRSPV